MATKLHSSRDANMNSISMNQLVHPGSPMGQRRHQQINKNGPATPKKSGIPNTMSYRDNNSRSRRDTTPPRDSNPYRPAFEDFDDPPSPTGSNYKDDRIQNDLLDEICSDIGIKDATDLDIFDFDRNTDQYITNQTRLPDDLDCLDETISFRDVQPEQYGDFDIPGFPHRQGKPGPKRVDQRPVSDEVKSASQDILSGYASDCLASPTVSSTCPGSASGVRPASQGSASGSPAIHSTQYSNIHTLDDIRDIRQIKKELSSIKKESDSPVPSPRMSCNGPPSVECLGRFGPPSVNNDRSDVSSTTPGPVDESSSCMLSSSPDKRSSVSSAPCTPRKNQSQSSRPMTPSRQYNRSQQNSSQYTSSQPQNTTNPYSSSQPPSTTNPYTSSQPPSSPFNFGNTKPSFINPHRPQNSSGVGTGSHNANSNLDPMAKDKVFRFLDQGQPGGGVSTEGPPETGSASSSPPQHVAKRARIINSGNDLLEEMRNRYAFTKGADMYNAPNQHPNIDGSYAPPPVPAPGAPQQDTQGYQGEFSSTPKINFADTSCMNPAQNSCAQPPQQFNSCSGNNVSFTGPQGVRYGSNNEPAMTQKPPEYNRSCSIPGNDTNQYNANQNMYGSCPNLGPQSGNMAQNQHMGVQQMAQRGRPYSPSGQVPVAQSRMSVPGSMNYQTRPGSGYGQQYQNSSSNNASMYPNNNNMYPNNNMAYPRTAVNQQGGSNVNSMPNVPMKMGMGESYNQNQTQWNQNQGYNNQGQGMYNRVPTPNSQQQMPNTQQVPQMPTQQQSMQINPAMRGMNQPMRGQYSQQPIAGQNVPSGQMNMQMRGPSPGITPYNQVPSPQMMGQTNMNPDGMPQGPVGAHMAPPQGPIDHQTPVSQQGFMQSIITDRSSAFRSHPLFPLLRDLIIADMNFHTPSFPFQLIANLPQDFDRLLQNYLQRNPPQQNYQGPEAVEGVIMDALKYAHRALIEKIQCRKQKEGYKDPVKPISAIEDFCERFDRAVKNSMVQSDYEQGITDPFMPPMGAPPSQPQMPHPEAHMSHMGGMMGPPQHQPPHLSHMNGYHSQSYQDLSQMKSMGPGPGPFPQMISAYHDRRSNSLPSTPRKSVHGRMHETETMLSRTGSDKNLSTGSGTGTGKSKVLPKEAVAAMMDWLRLHQDNPYPNDDEKEMLIQKTKLTINQINYWFTNARRRILPKWALQRYMEQQEKQKQLDQQQSNNLVTANH